MFTFTVVAQKRFAHSVRESVIGKLMWDDKVLISEKVITDISDSLREMYLSTDKTVRTYITQREIIKYLKESLSSISSLYNHTRKHKDVMNKLHVCLSTLDSFAQDKSKTFHANQAKFAVSAFESRIVKEVEVIISQTKWKKSVIRPQETPFKVAYNVTGKPHFSVVEYHETLPKKAINEVKSTVSLIDAIQATSLSKDEFQAGVKVVGVVLSDGKTTTTLACKPSKLKAIDMPHYFVEDMSALTAMSHHLIAVKEEKIRKEKEAELERQRSLLSAKIRSELNDLAQKFGVSVEYLKKSL